MRWVLLSVLALGLIGCGSPTDDIPQPQVERSLASPQFYPHAGYIEGNVIQPLSDGTYGHKFIKIQFMEGETTREAPVVIQPSTPIFIDRNASVSALSSEGIAPGDTIWLYPAGTTSTSDPPTMYAAEIVVIGAR